MGCTNPDIGQICVHESNDSSSDIIYAPSPDCATNLCLSHQQHRQDILGGREGFCTSECSTDDDCVKDENSTCEGTFQCAIPFTTGSFCCQKLCVCDDDKFWENAGRTFPKEAIECTASNIENTCKQ